jgi:PKD repeat protein
MYPADMNKVSSLLVVALVLVGSGVVSGVVFHDSTNTVVRAQPTELDGSAIQSNDGAIMVEVSNSKLESLSDITVELYTKAEYPDGEVLAVAKTNSQGEVLFDGLAVGTEPTEYVVRASDPNFQDSVRSVKLDPGQYETVQLSLKRKTGQITGDVVNEAMELLSGAEIELIDLATGEIIATTKTGSQGSYVFQNVPVGADYRVNATFDGETGSGTIEDLPEGTTNKDIMITGLEETKGSITAEVLDTDGDALSGIIVELYTKAEYPDGEVLAGAETGPQGKVLFEDLAVGTEDNRTKYVISATDPDWEYEDTTVQAELYEPGQTSSSKTLFLKQKTGSIAGDVLNENKEFLSGAKVELIALESGETIATTLTGSEGTYVFQNVPVGADYRVKATFDGETGSGTIEDLPPGTSNKDIIITGLEETKGSITAEVLDTDGDALSGITVELYTEAEYPDGPPLAVADTNSGGLASFSDLSIGEKSNPTRYVVHATDPDYQESTASVELYDPGQTTESVMLSLAPKTGTISGTVRTADDELISNAQVTLVDSIADETVETTTTQQDGSYAFSGVPYGTDYRIEATFDGETGSTTIEDLSDSVSGAGIVISGVDFELSASFIVATDLPKVDEPVTFDASQSKAEGGKITEYQWSFGDGSTATGVSASHTYTEPGEYTVELTVTDDLGNSDTATRTITVEGVNEPPTVSFSYSPTDPDEDESVQFNADASDPDGSITEYSWSFGDGSTASGASPTHTYTDPGEYTVEVTVTDDGGKTATATQTISVGDVNQKPDVSFSYSPTDPDEDESVQFNADASDPDGSITEYSWSFGDGSTASGASPTHTYTDPGEYTVEVTVTDDGGKTATATQTISVEDVNQKPTADFDFEPTSPQEGSTVTFEADASDPDGQITEYRWVFDDGSTAMGDNPYHTFDNPGEYDVKLAVKDNQGSEETVTREIEITPSPEPQILTVTPSTEGAALEGVQFENTYHVDIKSQQDIQEVRFTLDGTTKIDKNGDDGWSQSLNLGVLNGDSQLSVTAVDSDGDTDTYTAQIEVTGVPEWLEELKSSGEVKVDGDTIVISKSVPDPPIDASMTIPGVVPVIGGPQSFEARSEMRVSYEMPDEEAHVMANGELSVDILGRSGEGEITGEGELNAADWNLQNGEITVRVEVDAVNQNWEFQPETGVDAIDNRMPGVEASVTARPTVRLNAQIDNRNSNLEVTKGTVAPGIEVSGELYQSLYLFDISAGISGDLTGAVDVPEPYNPRATAKVSATGTASTLAQSASFTVGPIKESIGGGVDLESTTNLSAEQWSEWSYRQKQQGVPELSTTRVAVNSAQVQLIGHGNPMEYLESQSKLEIRETSENKIPVTLRKGRMMESPGSLTRLTLNGIEDREPAVISMQSGYGLVWARQDPNDPKSAGNDIYWRTNDGMTWSSPDQISNNTKIEFGPSIASDQESNQQLAAWTIVNENASETEGKGPGELINQTEIAFASNTAGNWSDPTIITSNDAIDSSAHVTHSGGRWLITWIRDSGQESGNISQHVRYALIDQDGSLLETGKIGQKRGTTHSVAPGQDGTFRLAFFGPTSNSQQEGKLVVGAFSDGFEKTNTYPVSQFRDLAVSSQSVAWASGHANETKLYFAQGESVNVVQSDQNTSDIIEVGLFSGSGTDVLTYRGEVARTGNKRIFYRIRQGDDWRSERSIAGGKRTNLTFWQAAYTPGNEGFLSVFMGRNFDKDQNNDLFAVYHAYNPDLAVDASWNQTMSIDSGEEFEISYNVSNVGDLPVTHEYNVSLYAGSERVATHRHDGLPVGENRSGHFTTVAGQYGSYTIRVAPTSELVELSKNNNKELIKPFRPDLRVLSATTARSGSQIKYNATVANTETVSASPVTYSVRNGNKTVQSGGVASIAANSTVQISGTVPVDQIQLDKETQLVIDPNQEIAETNEQNNWRSLDVLMPDLAVEKDAIQYHVQNGGVVASIDVANRGSGETTGTLQLTHQNVTIGETSFSISGAPQENSTVFKQVNVTLGQIETNETITLVAQSAVSETNTINNAAIDNVTVSGDGPPVIIGDSSASDPDGDGLFEDINGDGKFTLKDVQTLFEEADSDIVRNNSALFNFDNSEPPAVTLSDVRALFNTLLEQNSETAKELTNVGPDTLDTIELISLLRGVS